MSFDWLQLQCEYAGVPVPPRHVIFTVQGTGQPDPEGPGYPADLARTLDDEKWFWQPVGNYMASAFPMQPSINSGDEEFARLLRLQSPTQTWGFIGYSQGAIVTSDILDRCGITKNPNVTPDLADYADSFIGGVTWGNPRREAGHTIPNGIDPSGHGIVTPNLVGTPVSVWDFAVGKKMVNSPGQDLYTTCGYDGSTTSVTDEQAVWGIVDKGTITSFGNFIDQVLKIVGNPVKGTVAAIVAILDALNFFVLEGITPHTSYGVTQPIAGDPRDCWRIAGDYLNWIGENVPARS